MPLMLDFFIFCSLYLVLRKCYPIASTSELLCMASSARGGITCCDLLLVPLPTPPTIYNNCGCTLSHVDNQLETTLVVRQAILFHLA